MTKQYEITKLHIEMDEALGNMESHGFGLSDVASRTRKRYTGLIKKLEEEIAREAQITEDGDILI